MANVRFEVYFDEKFIDAIDNELDNDDIHFQDFLRFCKKFHGGEVEIFTDLPIEEISSKRKTSRISNNIVSSGTLNTNSLPNLNQQVTLDNFYSNTTGYKLFFLERDDINDLRRNFGLLYFNSTLLLRDWKYFSAEREDLCLPITNEPECSPRFDSWNYLQKFPHPINSIIICDRYILQDKRSFRSNLFEILKQLRFRNLLKTQIEILIISELANPRQSIDIEDYGNTIKDQLRNFHGIRDIKINLVKLIVDESNQGKFYREHGRSLITNYWYMNPQNSFNFFKYNNSTGALNLTVEDNMDFRFVFRKDVRNLLKARLRIFKDTTDNIEDTQTQKRIYGYPEITKKSRLLPMEN
ncbi:hypothetical protein [Dyadobacter psychrotolerans]|uniref:Uncharacterized protein n=1 Tax=Dyadobacter psychrotolerans TaxID=2541721 RepID=A0A4V2Z3X7_9BACT|nr:hypothetical protein [Dyadobacter psychrotolerans]TDE13928.1 hypothetical protein E0F88_18785 [Dyadobacter psychrotolerans]